VSESSFAIAGLAEALLQAADNAGLGVVLTRIAPTLKNVYVSARAARMLGVSVEEALELPPMDYVAPEARAMAMERVSARLQGGGPDPLFETTIRRADGTLLPVELGAARIEIEGQPASVVFLRDLTERREAEASARRYESRLSALFEAAPDAIVVSRGRGIRYANPAAATLLGHDRPEDLVGLPFDTLLNAEDCATMGERVALLTLGGPPQGPFEYRARTRDGRALVVEVTSILFEDEDGPSVLGFARNVTESRRLQAQLVRADRLAALGTMAAGVAHEINNPLAFMLLGVEAIERRVGGDADVESIRGTLADVRHGVERIAAIVRQLRAFSRPGASRATDAVDLRAILEAAARMASSEVRQYGTLEVDVPPELPLVRGDDTQLEQVFLNLLLNAAHSLEAKGGRVKLSARPAGSMVEVVVEDEGRGIEGEALPRIFDPFYTTKPVGQGTGLGLSIVHSIVTELGGEVLVETERGRGSTFVVRLPVLDRARRRSTPSRSEGLDAIGRALRILIVDDEPAFLRVMEQLLEVEHTVRVAASVEEAWQELQRDPDVELIVLDVMMPDASGVELFERIEAALPHLTERVIFVTGGTGRRDIDRFLTKAARPVLQKPFDAAKVAAVLRRYAR
jgi:PAS domain S-box-containing protein